MTRIKAVLSAAAALVLGSALAVGVALNQAGQNAVSPAMTCAEWSRYAALANDPTNAETFYIGIQGATTIPKAYGSWLIGDCAAGTCTVKPNACDVSVTWTYKVSPIVNGYRIARVTAIPYFGGGLKAWVSGTAGLYWLGSFGQARSLCVAARPAADCATMLGGVIDCWKRADGQWCRYGRLYGPGAGGSTTCTVQATDTPAPCVVNRGAGSESTDIARSFTDAELQ